MKTTTTILSFAAAVLFTSAAATAATVSFAGSNDPGDGAWNRPIGAGPDISGLGPVQYSAQTFRVDADGFYDIWSTQDYDGYLHLFSLVFDPQAPLVNLLAANDDALECNPDGSGIGFSDLCGQSLEAGVDYILVTSAYRSGDAGSFTNTVSGPGNIAIIPLPAAAWLMISALFALASGRRRQPASVTDCTGLS